MGENKRTRSDKRFRPVGRVVSRYGALEKVLHIIRDRHITKFSVNDIAIYTRILNPSRIKGLLKFTNGVVRVGDNQYEFDGNPIGVQNNV